MGKRKHAVAQGEAQDAPDASKPERTLKRAAVDDGEGTPIQLEGSDTEEEGEEAARTASDGGSAHDDPDYVPSPDAARGADGTDNDADTDDDAALVAAADAVTQADPDADALQAAHDAAAETLLPNIVERLCWTPSRRNSKDASVNRMFTNITDGPFGSAEYMLAERLPPWCDPLSAPEERNGRASMLRFIESLPYICNDGHTRRFTGDQGQYERDKVRFNLGCSPDAAPALHAALVYYADAVRDAWVEHAAKMLPGEPRRLYSTREAALLYLDGETEQNPETGEVEVVEKRHGWLSVTKGTDGNAYVTVLAKLYHTAEEIAKGLSPPLIKVLTPMGLSDVPGRAFIENKDGTIAWGEVDDYARLPKSTRIFACVRDRDVHVSKGAVNQSIECICIYAFPGALVRMLDSGGARRAGRTEALVGAVVPVGKVVIQAEEDDDGAAATA